MPNEYQPTTDDILPYLWRYEALRPIVSRYYTAHFNYLGTNHRSQRWMDHILAMTNEFRRMTCSHETMGYGVCTHGSVLVADLNHCYECGWDYAPSHFHSAPTGVEGQFCNECSRTHSRCIMVRECDTCSIGGVCYRHECPEWYDDDGYDDEDHSEDWTFLPGDKHPTLDLDRYTGVELECENGDFTPVFEPWFSVGTDASLEAGIEVRTPPANGTRLQEILEESCSLLDNAGWTTSSRCGTHVHIDMRDRANDEKFIAHLYSMFYAFESILYGLQGEDRQVNRYCAPLRRKSMDLTTVRGKKGIETLRYKWYGIHEGRPELEKRAMVREFANDKYHESRYSGINFHSILYRQTLEVRIHEGTLDERRLLLWISLLQSIIRATERSWPGYPWLQSFMSLPLDTQVKRMGRLLRLSPEVYAYVKENVRQVVL